MKRAGILVGSLGLVIVGLVACSINPQPLPPGEGMADDNSQDSGTRSPGGNDSNEPPSASDASTAPNPDIDASGTGADGGIDDGGLDDAGDDAGDGSADDDGGTDDDGGDSGNGDTDASTDDD